MTFTGFPKAYGTRDPAVQALLQFGYDRQTGVVGATLTLANAPVAGTLLLFKNGALLDDSADYTVAKSVVTLSVASIAGDVWQAYYHYSQNGA